MHAKVQWYIECTEIIICGRNIWSIDSLFWERSEREPSKWIVVISKLWRVQKNVFAVAIRGVVLWIHFKLYVHCADRKWSRLKLQHLVNSLNQTGLMVIKIPDWAYINHGRNLSHPTYKRIPSCFTSGNRMTDRNTNEFYSHVKNNNSNL